MVPQRGVHEKRVRFEITIHDIYVQTKKNERSPDAGTLLLSVVLFTV